MLSSLYRIEYVGRGLYDLFEGSDKLCSFTRHFQSLRASLEAVGRSSNWVGCMVRLFNQKFPVRLPVKSLSSGPARFPHDVDIVAYLRDRGYLVYRPLPITDSELISYIKSRGYKVEKGVGAELPVHTGE